MNNNIVSNAGYLFYRKYYNFNKEKWIDSDIQEKILKLNLTGVSEALTKNQINLISFELITEYPGLLVGSGYFHDISANQNEDNKKNNEDSNDGFKIGFYFDYSTGLPVIPGSSIKGALKSYLSDNMDEEESYFDFVLEYLHSIKKIKNNKIDQKAFIKKVFERINQEDQHISVYKRDIFFDAIPVYSKSESKTFAEDYTTPHLNELKNPIPIKFLKVMPGVKYKFNFILKDDQELNINAEEKKEIFRYVIKDLGLGAKTNVGYGKFK